MLISLILIFHHFSLSGNGGLLILCYDFFPTYLLIGSILLSSLVKMKHSNQPTSSILMLITVTFSGLSYQAKGLHKASLDAFVEVLSSEDTYVPSLISTASILRQRETYLSVSVQLDRMNHSVWSNVGLVLQKACICC